jgi:hypothetical protein
LNDPHDLTDAARRIAEAGRDDAAQRLEAELTVTDHPDHYTTGGIEVIDVLRAKLSAEQFEGFCLGNAIKYLTRAGHKGPATVDYRKARWYLDELIDDGEDDSA